MKTFAIAIQKGGTGKTATCAALAEAAAYKGYATLCIDLDPQMNLSYTIKMDTRPDTGNSYDILTGTPAKDVIQKVDANLSAICASENLATVTSGKGSARRLLKALEPIEKEFDYCFIDTPPTSGELQYNALQAADFLIIPLKADAYSLTGFFQMLRTARIIQGNNERLDIAGIVFTQYNGRANLPKQMKQSIEQKAAEMDISALGTIREGIAVQESAALQMSLFEYAPKSKPAADYMALFERLEAL